MIDIFKEVMQDGMEIVKCKEMSNKYKITLSYNGMNATCELNKLCTPGNEKSLCMRAIDTAMSTMYIDNGNYQEAKAWLDGERWNEKKGRVNKIIPNLQKVWDKFCRKNYRMRWIDLICRQCPAKAAGRNDDRK